MPAETHAPAQGEGGVLCRRCGRLLNGEGVLIIIGDDIEQFCSTAHAAEYLTARPALSQCR